MTHFKSALLFTLLTLQLQYFAAPPLAHATPSDGAGQLKFTPEYGSAGAASSPASIRSTSLLNILSSKLDNPNQSALDRVLKKTNHVRVFAGGEFNGKPLRKDILLDSKKPEVIASLKAALLIDEDPEQFGHDMCYGDPSIELMAGKKRLAVIGFHHGRAIRWDTAWKFDGPLKDGNGLVDWFAVNGIDGPKQAMEHEIKEKRRTSADLQKWIMSMPDCLRPFMSSIISPAMADVLVFLPEPSPADELRSSNEQQTKSHESPWQKQLNAVLDENFHDAHDKSLALLQWYASGIGPWNGFPTYEELPAELLLGLPTASIIEGLNSKNVSEPELEGAARYFASPTFRNAKPHDLTLIDAKLKKRLLEHCLKSDDEDKRKRAEAAFGASGTVKSADNQAQ